MPYHAWRISINIIIQTDDTNPVGLLLYYKYSASHPTDWFDVWTKAEPWVMTHPHKIKKIYFLLEKEKHNASHIGLHAVWSDQLYKCMSAKKNIYKWSNYCLHAMHISRSQLAWYFILTIIYGMVHFASLYF